MACYPDDGISTTHKISSERRQSSTVVHNTSKPIIRERKVLEIISVKSLNDLYRIFSNEMGWSQMAKYADGVKCDLLANGGVEYASIIDPSQGSSMKPNRALSFKYFPSSKKLTMSFKIKHRRMQVYLVNLYVYYKLRTIC